MIVQSVPVVMYQAALVRYCVVIHGLLITRPALRQLVEKHFQRHAALQLFMVLVVVPLMYITIKQELIMLLVLIGKAED